MASSASLTLTANDTDPVLRVQLSDVDGVYAIPAGAEVQVKIKGLGLAVVRDCTVEDRAQGIVTYDRSGEENVRPGNYIFQFVVTLGSQRRSFPSDGYLPVAIIADPAASA